jgi:hypothetical protein
MIRLLIIAACLSSCCRQGRAPEGWPWEREGGCLNVFYRLGP